MKKIFPTKNDISSTKSILVRKCKNTWKVPKRKQNKEQKIPFQSTKNKVCYKGLFFKNRKLERKIE